MRNHGWWRPAAWCVLALGTLSSGGCLSAFSPLNPPTPEQSGPCQALPECCRERVHIFMINGLTILPHVCGSMNGVADYVEQMGFCKPRVACHYWRWCFQNEIRKIHAEDPDARFVLVGYSIGGSVVYSMAQTLEADGIFIDEIIYIDAHSFIHDFNHRPANVGKVASLNSTGWFLPGKCHAGEDCVTINTVFHLAIPRKDETLQALARELNDVALGACHEVHTPPITPPVDGPGVLKGPS